MLCEKEELGGVSMAYKLFAEQDYIERERERERERGKTTEIVNYLLEKLLTVTFTTSLVLPSYIYI